MKIQLSPNRIVKDALVVWHEHGPEVDVVMDLKKLTFKENSIEEIYVFHVLEYLFTSEIPDAITNWRSVLQPGKDMYVVIDDFEFIARAFLGGELNLDILNDKFSYPTKISRDNILHFLKQGGYSEHETKVWYVDVPNLFSKKDHELVLSAKK